MDEDLKNVLVVGGGTILVYAAIISLIYQFTHDPNFIIIYVLILTLLLWVAFLQTKLNKLKKGGTPKDDKERT